MYIYFCVYVYVRIYVFAGTCICVHNYVAYAMCKIVRRLYMGRHNDGGAFMYIYVCVYVYIRICS